MIRTLRWSPAAILPLLLLAGSSLSGAVIEKVEFAETLQLSGHELQLNNVGLMRYKVVIKALVAGLYVEKGVPANQAFKDVAKRVEIEYFWALKGGDIAQAAETLLARNVSPATLHKLQPEIAQMRKLFRDVKPGDRYALTYLPGMGTELSLNGERQGMVAGQEFAAAYFTIWLGPQPMDVALRDQLFKAR